MLPDKNRIKKKKDIEKIFKKGKALKENFLLLKTIKNDFDFCRFGFVVSQKISKKANIRNKVKRKMREIVRLRIKKLNPSTDNLFIALSGIEKENFDSLEKTIEKLFKKAKIYG